MENILKPTSTTYTPGAAANQSVLRIEPLSPGYGVTLGNALRRVLLSSLPGAAITSVKIKGVQHEFGAIENVHEDVVDLILNLKRVRVKLHDDEPQTILLKVSGKKDVTASDFECPSQVEVTTPDAPICTITDAKGSLEMECVVQRGRGYLPTEERHEERNVAGVIAIDALFSPVVHVSLLTESARVGQRTDLDRVVIDITTDGSVTPEQAVHQALDILIDQFQYLRTGEAAVAETVADAETELAS